MTANHQVLKRPQDALAVWVEDLRKDSFKICAQETKIFDGIHKNIKVVSNIADPCFFVLQLFVRCIAFRTGHKNVKLQL